MISDTIWRGVMRHLAIGNGCWEWGGTITAQGYGVVYRGKEGGISKRMLAHRALYLLVNGSIPEDFEVDHLCRNKKCVRPDHLEAVTPAENMRRMGPFNRWTHCSK